MHLKRILLHTLFWLLSGTFLVIFFQGDQLSLGFTMMFVGLLLPTAIGTSMLFNYYLIPKLLFRQKILEFSLYAFTTMVSSLFLQMMVVLGTFVFIADYSIAPIGHLASNTLVLGIGTYLFVFLSALINLARRWSEPAQGPEFLTVRSDRKLVRLELQNIHYVESLDNYVKIHIEGQTILTKEKISSIEERLPTGFLRIHRSYLVNQAGISSFTREKVFLKDLELPISRTFKESVIKQLEGL